MTVRVLWKGAEVVRSDRTGGEGPVVLQLPEPRHAWSCEDPALYDLEFRVKGTDGTEDVSVGYFGFRSFSKKRDAAGNLRFALST